MIATALVWFFTFAFILGVGVLVNVITSTDGQVNRPLDQVFFLGFISISCVIGWLSLALPISVGVFWTILALVSIGLIILRKKVWLMVQYWREAIPTINKWNIALFILIVLIFTYAASAEIGLMDTSLYHAQNIKWIQEYAVVPGLGNIHGRFAFNSMFFQVSSLLSWNILQNSSHDIFIFPTNGVVMLVLIGKLLFGLFRNLKGSLSRALLYLLILAPILAMYPFWINAPSPDFIVAALVVYAFITFIEYDKNRTTDHVMIILITGVIVTSIVYKLSGAFLVLILIPLTLNKLKVNWPRMMAIFGVSVLIITPFLIRNYYLSGYLVYPLVELDLFDVDWKIPMDKVIWEKTHISNWAKVPRVEDDIVSAMSAQEWMPTWWQRKPLPMKAILGINAFGFISMIIFLIKRKWNMAIAQLACLVNFTFWFVNGPDPRFVHGFLFFGVGLNAFALSSLIPIKLNRYISGLLLLSGFGLALVGFLKSDMTHGNFVYPEGLAKQSVHRLEEPFTYYLPHEKNTCGNASLPCAQEPLENVEMRGQSISDGYRVHK